MTLGIIFNGQGAQKLGMGLDFAQAFPQSRAVFELAQDQSDYPLETWISQDLSPLRQTRHAQVAIAAASLAIYQGLEPLLANYQDRVYAGLSLGEYSALVAAGCLSMDQVFGLLKARGNLMSMHCQSLEKTAMLACMEVSEDQLLQTIHDLALQNKVMLANYNSPQQIVVAGFHSDLQVFTKALKQAGYKKVLPLKVEGPFHTSLMSPIQEAFAQVLSKVAFSQAKYPVYSNVNHEIHDPKTIRDRLVDHLTAPVKWTQTMEAWHEAGIKQIIQIGPGSTLSKLLAQHLPDIPVYDINQVEDLRGLETFLRSEP
ncbi:TPA: ACP S-malonyltransferase [Streptococcus suis]